MKKIENAYLEGILKGRMAESLVEELLRLSGNEVHRYGYEATIQNFSEIDKKIEKNIKTAELIRSTPDFVVVDKKGEPNFVEVKFRWDGKLEHEDDSDRLRMLANWGAKLIMVNCWEKPFFRMAEAPYVNERGTLVTKPLIESSEWKIKLDLYADCERLIEKYLQPTLVSLPHKAFKL